MPSVLKLILLILAFVLFIFASTGITSQRVDRVGVIALGLAFWVLTLIIP